MALDKLNRRIKIKRRIRKKVFGTAKLPRLTVFRSNKQIYAQLVDDLTGTTLVSASSYKNKEAEKGTKINQATVVGKLVADKAKSAGIETVVFDRNGYLYHGRVKALANSAREGGLKF
jgi:large subunit ribosomal protein L18